MQDQFQIWIATSRELTKAVKTSLESSQEFDQKLKILNTDKISLDSFKQVYNRESSNQYHQSLIPTTLKTSYPNAQHDVDVIRLRQTLHAIPGVNDHFAIFISRIAHQDDIFSNPIARAVQPWLNAIPGLSKANIRQLIDAESWKYQVYNPLLLLGPSTFSSQQWKDFVKNDTAIPRLSKLYATMASLTRCTHVAINAPIPLHNREIDDQLNILRSPSGLVPLYGHFGDSTDQPSSTAFMNVFWASSTQNGISQIFAPLHTMFSRGNIKEKARVIQLSQLEEKPYTAVDLYAGIGYFAFSYAKAGAKLVLGWEINGWSVEGFRRGASSNGWKCNSYQHNQSSLELNKLDHHQAYEVESLLAIFEESNEHAANRIEEIRNTIPPVRHINCGYLPSSKDSWWTAVQCLDPLFGGYIHAHENVGIRDIETRKLEIEKAFNHLSKRRFSKSSIQVQCMHVERVKSYAPGVVHCVYDLKISPGPSND